jgi:hypothetical protein
MAADRSEQDSAEQAEALRRDQRKFWVGVAILVALGLLFVWWSANHSLLNE